MNFVNLKKNHQKLRVDILIGWVLFSRMDPVFLIYIRSLFHNLLRLGSTLEKQTD